MERKDWQPIETCPVGQPVWTKIHDHDGERNEQQLIRERNLFWFTDKSMYVYYRPTHWAPL